MRVLVMGGTRFIGVYLTRLLVEQGHEVVLFNRGNKPAPVDGVTHHWRASRKDTDTLKARLSGESFDAHLRQQWARLADTQAR